MPSTVRLPPSAFVLFLSKALFCLFFVAGIMLTSCTTLDKFSKNAARLDNDLNKDSRRLIRDMKHDEG